MHSQLRFAVMGLWFAVAGVIHSESASCQQLYNIQAVALPGQSNSSLQAVSPNGQWAIGTSGNTAIAWSATGGTVVLPNIPDRNFQLPQSINNDGIGAGYAAATFFGSNPLSGLWNANDLTASVVPLPPGQTIGRVYGINDSLQMAGSVDGGSTERAATFTPSSASILPQSFAGGGVLWTAYDINNSGRIVGQGFEDGGSVTQAFYLDPSDSVATNIGSLTGLGHNSAIAFDVADNGSIVGTSSFNGGVDARPFLWQEGLGMAEIPLLDGTSQGSARGVNSLGQVVGNMSSATSILFYYEGGQTWRLQDLLVDADGWDLVNGTSNAAFGIAENGTIVGRGLYNGQITGFVLTAVPEPSSAGLLLLGVAAFMRRNRALA